jgi:hypothetical protein
MLTHEGVIQRIQRKTGAVRSIDLTGLLVQRPAGIRVNLLAGRALHSVARRGNGVASLSLPAAILSVGTRSATGRPAIAQSIKTLDCLIRSALLVERERGILTVRIVLAAHKQAGPAPGVGIRRVGAVARIAILGRAVVVGRTLHVDATLFNALRARIVLKALLVPGALQALAFGLWDAIVVFTTFSATAVLVLQARHLTATTFFFTGNSLRAILIGGTYIFW